MLGRSPVCTHTDACSDTGCVCKSWKWQTGGHEKTRDRVFESLQTKQNSHSSGQETHTHIQELSVLWTAAVSLDKGKLHTHTHTHWTQQSHADISLVYSGPVFSGGYVSLLLLMMSRAAACFCRWNIHAGLQPAGSQSHPLQLWIRSQTSANSPTLKENSCHSPLIIRLHRGKWFCDSLRSLNPLRAFSVGG